MEVLKASVEVAKGEFKNMTMKDTNQDNWKLVFSNSASKLWSRKDKDICVRGSFHAPAEPKVIMKWLVEENLIIGFEGISSNTEVNCYKQSNEEEFLTVTDVTIKTKSLMSPPRQFAIVTSLSANLDGKYFC